MSGRHTGPFVTYDDAGEVASAMPPTGRTFGVTHSHWLRVHDGQVIEHWANRDDLGQAFQLGWVPPSPWFLLRAARAKRRARRQRLTRRTPGCPAATTESATVDRPALCRYGAGVAAPNQVARLEAALGP